MISEVSIYGVQSFAPKRAATGGRSQGGGRREGGGERRIGSEEWGW